MGARHAKSRTNSKQSATSKRVLGNDMHLLNFYSRAVSTHLFQMHKQTILQRLMCYRYNNMQVCVCVCVCQTLGCVNVCLAED